MPNASELIVQCLEEAGVEYVFGIPGGGTGSSVIVVSDLPNSITKVTVTLDTTNGDGRFVSHIRSVVVQRWKHALP